MTVIPLLTKLRQLGVKLWDEEGQLRIDVPEESLPADIRQAVDSKRSEILRFLNTARNATRHVIPEIGPAKRGDRIPLSSAQKRLWFLDHWDPGSATYNVGKGLRLTGPISIVALRHSLDEVVQRHEVLRTTFVTDRGTPAQVVAPKATVKIQLMDLQGLPRDEPEVEAQSRVSQEVRLPFDLSSGPLTRCLLVRLSPREHLFVMTQHHIISDGWSKEILFQEIFDGYSARLAGRPSALAELPIQYADYAIWQQEALEGPAFEPHVDYWKKHLGGKLPVLRLPTDRLRPAKQTYDGQLYTFTLPREVNESLQRLCQGSTTAFMVVLAAFKVLLNRYTGETDVLVGTPIANRERSELEKLVGFFLNTLVLRTDLGGDPDFRTLLARVRENTLAAFTYQGMPFERLVEILQPDRELSHTPLFQVMFVWQTAPGKPFQLPGVLTRSVDVDTGAAKFDLSLAMAETDAGLRGWLEFNTELFDIETIKCFVEHFQRLLESIGDNADRRISQLPVLSADESTNLLSAGRAKARYPHGQCLHQQFEQIVARSPDSIAVVFDGCHLTYQELNQRANQLAHYLRTLGVGPETPVGLYLERSADLVVGILAILKAGGAYVPVEPSTPTKRAEFILRDACVTVVLTDQKNAARLPTDVARVVSLDSEAAEFGKQPKFNPTTCTVDDNLAYVIYTSGSTGNPKGVGVTHYNVSRLFLATEKPFDLGANDVWSLFHSAAFDFSVWELWGPLLYGGRLVVVPYWVSRAPDEFRQLLLDEGVTILNQTPSSFQLLLSVQANLPERAPDLAVRLVVFGGEKLETGRLGAWFNTRHRPPGTLVNMYGITETTVHVTATVVTADDVAGNVNSLGDPIADLDLYILDKHLEPVPPLVTGELHVGGAGLSRGYHNHPALTAERFIPDPHGSTPSGRLYRSGDLANLRRDGGRAYLGRADDQVKIRGFRIELGEVEAVLLGHPDVRHVVVVAHDPPSAHRILLAYVVPRDDRKAVGDLDDYARTRLPDHMLPSRYMWLESLPLTANGKLDRDALPQPDTARPELGEEYAEPETETERKLAAIFASALNLDQVGRHDGFFTLGGDSIRSIQVVGLAKEAGLDLTVQNLFQYKTVYELSRRLDDEQSAAEAEPDPADLENDDILNQILKEVEGLSAEQVKTRLHGSSQSGSVENG